jgi:hypothetical protein
MRKVPAKKRNRFRRLDTPPAALCPFRSVWKQVLAECVRGLSVRLKLRTRRVWFPASPRDVRVAVQRHNAEARLGLPAILTRPRGCALLSRQACHTSVKALRAALRGFVLIAALRHRCEQKRGASAPGCRSPPPSRCLPLEVCSARADASRLPVAAPLQPWLARCPSRIETPE